MPQMKKEVSFIIITKEESNLKETVETSKTLKDFKIHCYIKSHLKSPLYTLLKDFLKFPTFSRPTSLTQVSTFPFQ